jgi:hypothetical protein
MTARRPSCSARAARRATPPRAASQLGAQRLERLELAERLGEVVVEHRSSLDPTTLTVALPPRPRRSSRRGRRRSERDLALLTRLEPDRGVVDLGQHVAGADQKLVAVGSTGRDLDGDRVIDHDETPVAAGRSTARNCACCSRM